MASELATAYLSLAPKLESGFGNTIQSQLSSSIDGKSIGDTAGAGFSGAFTGALSKIAVPAAIATAIAGIGKMGFDAYSKVEEGANNVIIATGATGEAANELTAVYKNVASSVVGDFGDIGEAVGELNTRLGLQGDSLEAASEAAMKYAKVNGVDAKTAIADVTRMMNNAGISSEDYSKTLDTLTVAAQQSGIDVNSLAQSVTANAASFRELGFSTNESIAMLASFEKGGVNASQVLAGMKKGVAEWTKEGKSAQGGFSEFVSGIQDGSVTSADAIEIFGSRAGIAMYDAAKNGQLNFDEMYAAIAENSEGALDEVYNNTLTASERMSLAWQNVTLAGAEMFAPVAEAIAGFLTDVVVPFSQQLVGYVGQAKSAFESSGIAEAVQGAAASVQGAVQPVIDWIASNVLPLAASVYGEIAPVVQQIAADIGSAMPEIGNVVNSVMSAIGSIVQTVWPAISSAVSAAADVVRAVIPPAWEAVKSAVTTASEGARAVADAVWPVISNIVSAAASGITSAIDGISSVVSGVQSTFDAVKNAITNPIETAKGLVESGINAIKNIISGMQLKLPSIPLPHFWVSGGSAPWGIGGQGSPPEFGVNWYARGGIVDGATLIGAGESGPEAIVPLSGDYMRPFAKAIAQEMGGGGDTYIVNGITLDSRSSAQRCFEQAFRELRIAERA